MQCTIDLNLFPRGLPATQAFDQMLTDQGSYKRDRREQDHKDDGNIENQLLNTAPRLEGGINARGSKGATQSGATYLEQNEENDGKTQDNLNNANRRKPLLQDYSSLSI